MTRLLVSSFALVTLCLSTVAAFVPQQSLHKTQQKSPARKSNKNNMVLLAKKNNNNINDIGKMMKGVAASAVLLGTVLVSDPAVALTNNAVGGGVMTPPDFGSSQVIAGRSGGRVGGRGGGGYRSSSSRMVAPSRMGPSSSRSYSRTTIVRPMIAPSPIIVSPFGGYGYNPMGGFGLGYGLGAMNDIGREMRQEGQIRNTETELEAAQRKNAELEMRLKALEQNQQQQLLQQPQAP